MSKGPKNYPCPECNKKFRGREGWEAHHHAIHELLPVKEGEYDADTKPDWKHSCEVCGQKPILPITGMCGPCTFGEADTYGGNW